MNFFEHHIGDYDQATAHLTACEDGIYSRLIRWYYASEAPLPTDLQAIQRRVRAHSRDEKAAVKTILAEFFELREDGYHQHRCDEVIAAYHDAEPEREARRENARERQRRARERRQTLFDALRGHGIVPPFDTTTAELERTLSRVTGSKSSPPVTQPVTRDDTVTQYPLPTSHFPEEPPLPPEGGDGAGEEPGPPGIPSRYGEVVLAMKTAGMPPTMLRPHDQTFRALVDAGATPAEFAAVVPAAMTKDKPWPYALSVVEGNRRRAKEIADGVHRGPMPGHEAAEDDPELRTQASVERLAGQHGLPKWDGCEVFPAYRARVLKAAGITTIERSAA